MVLDISIFFVTADELWNTLPICVKEHAETSIAIKRSGIHASDMLNLHF